MLGMLEYGDGTQTVRQTTQIKKNFDIFYRARACNSKYFIMLLARAKLKFLR